MDGDLKGNKRFLARIGSILQTHNRYLLSGWPFYLAINLFLLLFFFFRSKVLQVFLKIFLAFFAFLFWTQLSHLSALFGHIIKVIFVSVALKEEKKIFFNKLNKPTQSFVFFFLSNLTTFFLFLFFSWEYWSLQRL